jgi:hypothetical protein
MGLWWWTVVHTRERETLRSLFFCSLCTLYSTLPLIAGHHRSGANNQIPWANALKQDTQILPWKKVRLTHSEVAISAVIDLFTTNRHRYLPGAYSFPGIDKPY